MAAPSPPSIAQTLPPYIIYQILRHFSAPLVVHRIAEYPWYLAHVCSSWRIEFLAMRQNFWNEIILHVWPNSASYGLEAKHLRVIDMLTMFLACNRGHPFSFRLRIDDRETPHFLTIYQLLISESHRWQRVTLQIRLDDILGFYRVKGQLEHLESLQFSIIDASYAIPEIFTDLFMTAPRLTRCSLERLLPWNFNWSIMTYMYLGRSYNRQEDVEQLLSILPQAGRLETLIVCFGDVPLTPPLRPVVLPSLLSLVTDTWSLIPAITIPSLKELAIQRMASPEVVDILKPFFSRSRCHLQALKLININAAQVIKILSYTPDIVTLYLSDIRDLANVFGWLNEMHTVDTPKLTSLQLLILYGYHLPAQDQMFKILDFVAQRKTRVGSVVENSQTLKIECRFIQSEGSEAFEKQLRNACKLNNIHYSNWCSMNCYANSKDVHDRSRDPYVYHSYEIL